MGRERQKKKNRSSLQKVKAKPNGRTKAGKKKVNFMGNAIISENWYAPVVSIQLTSLVDILSGTANSLSLRTTNDWAYPLD